MTILQCFFVRGTAEQILQKYHVRIEKIVSDGFQRKSFSYKKTDFLFRMFRTL